MINCPCCSNQMLRHIGQQGIYWFCPHCYQEMPNLETIIKGHRFFHQQDVSTFAFRCEKKVLVASV